MQQSSEYRMFSILRVGCKQAVIQGLGGFPWHFTGEGSICMYVSIHNSSIGLNGTE